MTMYNRSLRKLGLAVMAAGSLAIWQQAYAAGTAANTSINNKATVSYTVGSVVQTPIESSPTGNSTAGVGNGTNTAFVVDNKIDLTVVEVGATATIVTPGQTLAVTTFTVTNTGNSPQGYQLLLTNLTGGTLFGGTDNTDVAALAWFVDSNANGSYQAGVDTATAIDTLAADATITVFGVVTVPGTATNNQFANVRLRATAADPGTNGATLVTETAGADTAGTVDVVFADTDRNGWQEADDQYAVQSAALAVAKASSVVNDPINGATNPKAIPGAYVEYAITMTNTGAMPANGVAINDPLPANTTFRADAYGASQDVRLQVGSAAATYCIAESPSDTNNDGCYRNASGELIVGGGAMPVVATGAANAVTVRFQVVIQ